MTILQDIRFAFRTLRKNLSVTTLAVVSLALAIAGNATVFSLVNSFLFRPLPYQEVERLVFIGEINDEVLQGQLGATISMANYLEIRERQTSFESMAAFEGGVATYDTGGDQPEQLTIGKVTPGFFETLGAESTLGRPFLEEEGIRGRDRVAVLSHDFWSERFGGDANPVGETLKLNGEHYEIVGVLGEDFDWLFATNTSVWTPLVIEHGSATYQRDGFTLAIGRLADGVGDDQAKAEMDTLMAQMIEERPDVNRGYQIQLLNMKHDIPDQRNTIFFMVIQGALIFVLLIACSNIANLLLSRSQAREREISIRNSLGASRRRIVFQLFTESMIMASIAGVIGVALGFAGMKYASNALAAFLPKFWIPTLDLRVLGFCLAVTIFGGMLFGLAPVLQTARFDLLSGLKDGTQGSTTGGRRRWASNALVVAELAFAIAFLGGASMMISTFKTMQTSDAGFNTEDTLVMLVGLPDTRYASGAEQADAAEQINDRLGSLPGVRTATYSSLLPRMPFIADETFEIAGQPSVSDQDMPKAGSLAIGPQFFETLGIQVRRGREFSDADREGAAPVAVINTAAVERFWSGDNPIGQRIEVKGVSREIVGVVESVQHDVLIRGGGDKPFIYLPWMQSPTAGFFVSLRADVEAGTLSEPVRKELLTFDRTVSVAQMQTLDAFIEQFWVGQNLFTVILGGFGLLALILAALGTYGVLAYSVARRTHEIGIRMAIGASRGKVLKMIVGQGLSLGVIGLVLSLPLLFLATRLIAAIFEGLVPVEPASMLTVVAVLGLVTLVASAIPARRAATVDPIEALRTE